MNANEHLSGDCVLTIREVAFLAGTSQRVVERLVEFEVVCPECSEPEPVFTPTTLEHVKKAIRLHDHLGIGWSAIGYVMELIGRIEMLESALKELAEQRKV